MSSALELAKQLADIDNTEQWQLAYETVNALDPDNECDEVLLADIAEELMSYTERFPALVALPDTSGNFKWLLMITGAIDIWQ